MGNLLARAAACLLALACAAAAGQVRPVPREEMPAQDIAACEAMAQAFSRSEEWRHLLPETPPGTEEVAIAGQAFAGSVQRVAEQVLLPGQPPLAALRVLSGGSCDSDTILLARPGRGPNAAYRVVVDDVAEPEAEADPEERIRWSSWGAGDRLVRLQGRLYKVRGRFGSETRPDSVRRRLNVLFAPRAGQWQPICAFDTRRERYRTTAGPAVCRALAIGALRPREDAPSGRTDRFFLTSAGSNGGGLWVDMREYASGAGCGGTFRWLYAEDEFRDRSWDEVRASGAPHTLALNGVPADADRARVVRELFERYPKDAPSSGHPAFASAFLELESTAGDTVLIRPRDTSAGDPRFDLEVVGAADQQVQVACQAQRVSSATVRFWYRADTRGTR